MVTVERQRDGKKSSDDDLSIGAAHDHPFDPAAIKGHPTRIGALFF